MTARFRIAGRPSHISPLLHARKRGIELTTFRLLGPLRIGRTSPTEITSPSVRALLAALLLQRGEPISRGRLMMMLWNDPPASAEANLRQYAARLRTCLGRTAPDQARRLRTIRGSGESGSYQLLVEPEQLDVARFFQLGAEARKAADDGRLHSAATLLESALALWSGPSAGMNVSGSLYLQDQLRVLTELKGDAEEFLLETQLAYLPARKLVPTARKLVAEHPLRERSYALLIRCLYAAGDSAEALGIYDRARSRLNQELGLEPGPALQQLFLGILRHDNELIYT
ncbi:AfsR/SARP family transcriptional regulator [Nonomuraea sp. MG754425]|uniref:AfsR/SARP family transcriptional regulator n=1 Tax=Nonomuraea sp. MG754425 TaxID=2570319 RepID=UPI001F3199C7|nr:AfsR/SARP family transcriptional regulator [Nonomuraea sp. MG754425]